MDFKLIMAVFLVGTLLFGCIGESTPPTNTGGTGPVTNTQPQTNNSQGAVTGGSNNAGTSNNADVSDESQTGLSNDLTDIAWSELIALGTPVECTLKYKDATLVPGFEKATIYMKGDQYKAVMSTSLEDVTTTITIISKNDGFVYMTYADSAMMATLTQGKIVCDGIKTETNMSDTSSSSTTVDTSAFEDTDKVELDCKPGLFGDEMFQLSGKYCTLEEITTAMTGGVDPCEQITDPQTKAQCQQALGG